MSRITQKRIQDKINYIAGRMGMNGGDGKNLERPFKKPWLHVVIDHDDKQNIVYILMVGIVGSMQVASFGTEKKRYPKEMLAYLEGIDDTVDAVASRPGAIAQFSHYFSNIGGPF